MFSIAFHLIMLAMICIYSPARPLSIVKKETGVLPSYLYFANTSRSHQKSQTETTSSQKKLSIRPKNNIGQPIISQAAKRNESVTHQSFPAHQQATSLSKEQDKLLLLLHNAIQEVQQYPANAMEMEREGRVTAEFTLCPNGTILNLHLLHSSGTTSLDEAALVAIRQAAPFQGVNQYLNAKQTFSIDVVFAL